MRFGFLITAGDPRTGGDLAADAEATGWDGVFSWDGIAIGEGDTYDPWVSMAAMAMRTALVPLGMSESDWTGETVDSLRRRIAGGPPRV